MDTLDDFMVEFEKFAPEAYWLMDYFYPLIRAKFDGNYQCPGCFVATKLGKNSRNQILVPGCTELFAGELPLP